MSCLTPPQNETDVQNYNISEYLIIVIIMLVRTWCKQKSADILF